VVVSSIGQVAEIVTMLVLGAVLTRLGWKWTMICGILGHAIRYGVFAVFADSNQTALIIAVQVLHGVCYAFFFATVYIFVDAISRRTFAPAPKVPPTCSSSVWAWWWPACSSPTRRDVHASRGEIDYQRLFLVPTVIAIAGIALLLFFRPPTHGPARRAGSAPAPH
jgi:MFS family permease